MVQDLKFVDGEKVLLKVPPIEGVIRFINKIRSALVSLELCKYYRSFQREDYIL